MTIAKERLPRYDTIQSNLEQLVHAASESRFLKIVGRSFHVLVPLDGQHCFCFSPQRAYFPSCAPLEEETAQREQKGSKAELHFKDMAAPLCKWP